MPNSVDGLWPKDPLMRSAMAFRQEFLNEHGRFPTEEELAPWFISFEPVIQDPQQPGVDGQPSFPQQQQQQQQQQQHPGQQTTYPQGNIVQSYRDTAPSLITGRMNGGRSMPAVGPIVNTWTPDTAVGAAQAITNVAQPGDQRPGQDSLQFVNDYFFNLDQNRMNMTVHTPDNNATLHPFDPPSYTMKVDGLSLADLFFGNDGGIGPGAAGIINDNGFGQSAPPPNNSSNGTSAGPVPGSYPNAHYRQQHGFPNYAVEQASQESDGEIDEDFDEYFDEYFDEGSDEETDKKPKGSAAAAAPRDEWSAEERDILLQMGDTPGSRKQTWKAIHQRLGTHTEGSIRDKYNSIRQPHERPGYKGPKKGPKKGPGGK